MLTNGKKECPFTDEIVSYMYGEIDGVERSDFETHLAGCSTCTDDFAAISNSRFSVFEWRKEEFDHLATPSIVIPELAKSAAAGSESGWFAGLAALLAFARSPMVVATVSLICLGVAFIGFSYFRSSESLVANRLDVPAVKSNELEDKKLVIDRVLDTRTPSDQPIEPTAISASRKRAGAYKTSQGTEIRRAVNSNPKRGQSTRMATKPDLNNFKEETDDSLRLSDLFDEVGG